MEIKNINPALLDEEGQLRGRLDKIKNVFYEEITNSDYEYNDMNYSTKLILAMSMLLNITYEMEIHENKKGNLRLISEN